MMRIRYLEHVSHLLFKDDTIFFIQNRYQFCTRSIVDIVKMIFLDVLHNGTVCFMI